jgi:hypothetical protein
MRGCEQELLAVYVNLGRRSAEVLKIGGHVRTDADRFASLYPSLQLGDLGLSIQELTPPGKIGKLRVSQGEVSGECGIRGVDVISMRSGAHSAPNT